MTDRSMLEIEEMNGAKYINPYTDDSLKVYRDMKNDIDKL